MLQVIWLALFGEVSAIALCYGRYFIFWQNGLLHWHIPLSYLAGFLAIVIPSWLIAPERHLVL